MKLFCEKSFDLFACEFEKLLFLKGILKMVPVFYALVFARQSSIFSRV